jgi:hypothetical protein
MSPESYREHLTVAFAVLAPRALHQAHKSNLEKLVASGRGEGLAIDSGARRSRGPGPAASDKAAAALCYTTWHNDTICRRVPLTQLGCSGKLAYQSAAEVGWQRAARSRAEAHAGRHHRCDRRPCISAPSTARTRDVSLPPELVSNTQTCEGWADVREASHPFHRGSGHDLARTRTLVRLWPLRARVRRSCTACDGGCGMRHARAWPTTDWRCGSTVRPPLFLGVLGDCSNVPVT